jgi:hypothetical protein
MKNPLVEVEVHRSCPLKVSNRHLIKENLDDVGEVLDDVVEARVGARHENSYVAVLRGYLRDEDTVDELRSRLRATHQEADVTELDTEVEEV